jgi:hypothetical protein
VKATLAIAIAVTLPALGGCGGGPAAPPPRTVFDPSGQTTPNAVAVGWVDVERPYAGLDVATSRASEPMVGVSVLNDSVRLSRPTRWMIRDASNDAGRQFVRYVSPRGYSFAVYQLSDAPSDAWQDIQQRYEVDVAAAGAKMVGQHIAMSTSTTQGRGYTIERKVEGARSRSREVLLRGDHLVVLVQVVTQEDSLSRISDELLEVFKRIEVR